MVVAIFVAIPAVALAWVDGRLDLAISLGAFALSWCVILFAVVRKVARHREISTASHLDGRTLNRKRVIVLERVVSLLVLTVSVASLVKALVSGLPLYFTLGMVWFMIASGSHFLFVLVARLAAHE